MRGRRCCRCSVVVSSNQMLLAATGFIFSSFQSNHQQLLGLLLGSFPERHSTKYDPKLPKDPTKWGTPSKIVRSWVLAFVPPLLLKCRSIPLFPFFLGWGGVPLPNFIERGPFNQIVILVKPSCLAQIPVKSGANVAPNPTGFLFVNLLKPKVAKKRLELSESS